MVYLHNIYIHTLNCILLHYCDNITLKCFPIERSESIFAGMLWQARGWRVHVGRQLAPVISASHQSWGGDHWSPVKLIAGHSDITQSSPDTQWGHSHSIFHWGHGSRPEKQHSRFWLHCCRSGSHWSWHCHLQYTHHHPAARATLSLMHAPLPPHHVTPNEPWGPWIKVPGKAEGKHLHNELHCCRCLFLWRLLSLHKHRHHHPATSRNVRVLSSMGAMEEMSRKR